VDQSIQARGRRVVTPAVTAAAAFAVVAAIFSVAFVTARGGLQMPVAPSSGPGVALASPLGTGAPLGSPAPSSTAPTATAVVGSPAPSAGPSLQPSPEPTPEPSAGPSAGPTPIPSAPVDPLLALAPCPGHPGCYLYTVRRGDTFSGVSDRFGLLLWITRALNPEVADTGIIVVGHTLYLGHDPTARLDPCPNGDPCHLYVVRSGDTVSTIAGRYGLSSAEILAINPGLDPTTIVPGQTIRLPLYQG
jgi:nucleoid-associated protein YgaU